MGQGADGGVVAGFQLPGGMFAAVAPGAAGGGAKAGADGDVGQARQLRQADACHPPQRFTLPLRAVGGVGFGVALQRRRHRCFQAGPQAAQEAGRGRGLDLPRGLVERHVAHQMQTLARPGGRHVQQPIDFVRGAARLACAQVARDRVGLGFGARLDRAEQHAAAALLEAHQRRLVAARRAVQAVQDDGFELQALGLVHGHDLDCAVVLVRRIGRGEEPRYACVQRCGVDAAVRCQAFDQLEKAFRVIGHRQAGIQRRAAQAAPQRFHPRREWHGAGVVALVQQDGRHLAQALEFVGAEQRLRRRGFGCGRGRVEQGTLGRRIHRRWQRRPHDAQGALKQHRHRGDVVVAEQALQGRQRQAAIGRAQHRQPRQPVAGMRQRAHQLH
ncbi:hypothetical protein ACMA110817_23565 [Achromobacter marplatensis]